MKLSTRFIRNLFLALSLLFIVYCSKKDKGSVTDVHQNNPEKYERGFVHEDEVLDVNFDPTLIGAFSPQTEKKLQLDSVSYFYGEFKDFEKYKSEINEFYKNRNDAYAWFDEDGLTEQADHLAAKLLHLEKDGNEESLTYHEQFSHMMDNEIEKKDEEKIELMLTAQYIEYSKRNFSGKAGEIAKNENWLKPRNKFDAVEAMKIADKNGGVIFPYEPKHQHYVALKNKILDFHKKGLDTVSSKIAITTLKKGDSSTAVAQIRERLVMLGDLKNTAKSGEFDDEMMAAIHQFQYRNGLDSSNVIGKSVIEKMNVSGRETLEKMLINLERMRWISPEDDEYLLVNIPSYKLFTYDKGQEFLWDMDVIVGSVNRRTVVFSDKMDYIDFAPYWNIPPGIMKRKILPAMKRSSSYLARNNMEKTGAMLTKDIPAVRQKPGPGNTLGKAKFMFPNTYNIYLHDTNEHNLFRNENRNLSSGCVRVADAFKLAQFVLKDNKEITDSLITKKMNAAKENRVKLAKKMPVHLAYFTTWVDPRGNLVFSPDIYKRDQKLKKMMMTSTVAAENIPSKNENSGPESDSSKTAKKAA